MESIIEHKIIKNIERQALLNKNQHSICFRFTNLSEFFENGNNHAEEWAHRSNMRPMD